MLQRRIEDNRLPGGKARESPSALRCNISSPFHRWAGGSVGRPLLRRCVGCVAIIQEARVEATFFDAKLGVIALLRSETALELLATRIKILGAAMGIRATGRAAILLVIAPFVGKAMIAF